MSCFLISRSRSFLVSESLKIVKRDHPLVRIVVMSAEDASMMSMLSKAAVFDAKT
jgi:hypothetical protein